MTNNEFDIEQYRMEHQMDYIKAIDLLNISSNKDEVFHWIYQITRWHIPDVLYKYFSFTDDENLNNLKLNTLSEKKIFLADSKDFNDPFDNKAFYYRNEDLSQFEELGPFDGQIGDEIMFSSRAASFTKTGFNSMPMWAHYANNHRGFCVSYNLQDSGNIELAGSTLPIQYTDQRIDITNILVNYVDLVLKEKRKQISEGRKKIILNDLTLVYIIVFLQNIKQTSWQYEQEFRCVAGRTSIGMPFMKAIPSAIFAGEKCSPFYIERLCGIARDLNVPLYKLEFQKINMLFQLEPIRIL
ncbi:DUF2971 domain-containing protein [Cohnella nanjingensis]|nr:DUF2971 domain-containing protein [Cohnella nanjingensis]